MFQTENKILRKKEKRSYNVVCVTDTSTGDSVAQEHEAKVRILIRKKHPLNWPKPVAVAEKKVLKSTG